MSFYGEICGIPENVPRFLKNAFHIPEESHLGLASLLMESCFVLLRVKLSILRKTTIHPKVV